MVGLGADQPSDIPGAKAQAARHCASSIIEIGDLCIPKELIPAAARGGEPAVEG